MFNLVVRNSPKRGTNIAKKITDRLFGVGEVSRTSTRVWKSKELLRYSINFFLTKRTTSTGSFYTNAQAYLLVCGFSRPRAVLKYVSLVCFQTFFYTVRWPKKAFVMLRCFAKATMTTRIILRRWDTQYSATTITIGLRDSELTIFTRKTLSKTTVRNHVIRRSM